MYVNLITAERIFMGDTLFIKLCQKLNNLCKIYILNKENYILKVRSHNQKIVCEKKNHVSELYNLLLRMSVIDECNRFLILNIKSLTNSMYASINIGFYEVKIFIFRE